MLIPLIEAPPIAPSIVAVEAVRLREQAPPEVETFIYAPPAR
jgi:hypothetical protein